MVKLPQCSLEGYTIVFLEKKKATLLQRGRTTTQLQREDRQPRDFKEWPITN